MVEETTRKGKGVATNRNEFGVEFKSKNSKVQLNKIEVVVHANKMVRPELKSKTSYIWTRESCPAWVKGDLNRKA